MHSHKEIIIVPTAIVVMTVIHQGMLISKGRVNQLVPVTIIVMIYDHDD